MTKIIGIPKRLSLRVGRVLSDKDFGSFRVEAEIEVTLEEGDDADASFQSVAAWLKASVGSDIKDQKKQFALKQQLEPMADDVEWDTGPPNWPDDAPNVPVTAPGSPVAQNTGQLVTETWTNPGMTLEFTKGGDRYLRVKGGKWTKFGAPAWKESLPFDISEWAERGGDGQKTVHSLPDGLQDVVVQMKVKDGKTVPDKVIGFQ